MRTRSGKQLLVRYGSIYWIAREVFKEIETRQND